MRRSLSVIILFAAVLCLSTVSCSDRTSSRSRIQGVLSAADSLMMTDPQAALDTLLTVDSAEVARMRRGVHAFYTLLRTEAEYKCWLPVGNDTSIFESTAYYNSCGPGVEEKLARALMMTGAVFMERSQPVLALESYKEAERIIEVVGDSEQYGLLHTKIGLLYQRTFNDIPSAVYRYRSALLCFESEGVAKRLPSSCLTLSRVLLADKDSLDVWKDFYAKGIEYAKNTKDSLCIVDGLDQYVRYLSLYKKDYSKVIEISKYVLRTYSKYCKYDYYCDFTSLISESYAYLGEMDSAKLYAGNIPRADAVSTMIWHEVSEVIAKCSKDWKAAYMHETASQVIRDSLTIDGEIADLQNREQYLDIRYLDLLRKYERRGYQVIILMIVSVLMTLVFIVLAIRTKYKTLRLKIRKILDSAKYKYDIELDVARDADDIEILSAYLQNLIGLMKVNKASIDAVLVLKTQLAFMNDVLDSYYVYCGSDRFSIRIADILDKNFPKKEIRRSVIYIAEVLFPGFLNQLQSKYGLSDSDLYYISLLLCGFSNRSQQILTRTKIESISVARSKVAAKVGKNMMLSKLVVQEVEEYTTHLNSDRR